MKLFHKIAASVLLLVNGSAAIYGGLNLVIYPDGSKLGLSDDLLRYSVFDNYLVPGLLLLAVIGLFNIYTLIALIASFHQSNALVILQGTILAFWLIVQMALIHFVSPVHIVMFIVSILLIIVGVTLVSDKEQILRPIDESVKRR